MSTAILDRVENLANENKAKLSKQWLDLVRAYVDGGLNDAAKIAAVFEATGKGRADLERDGELVREYRTLQSRLDQIPKLQAEYDELAKQLHDAIAEREAAEKTLRDAQEKCMQIGNRSSLLSQSIYLCRQVVIEMKDPKFHAINSAVSANPEADALKQELAKRERRILELGTLIESKEEACNVLDAEAFEVEIGDMEPKEKEAKLLQICQSKMATRETIGRLQVEQQELRQELAYKRGKGRTPTFGASVA